MEKLKRIRVKMRYYREFSPNVRTWSSWSEGSILERDLADWPEKQIRGNVIQAEIKVVKFKETDDTEPKATDEESE